MVIKNFLMKTGITYYWRWNNYVGGNWLFGIVFSINQIRQGKRKKEYTLGISFGKKSLTFTVEKLN